MDRMEKFLHKTFEQTKDIARGVTEEMQKTLEQTKGLTKDFLEKFNLSASQFLGKTVEIEGKRLRIKELVGEGGFGFVFLCQEFTTNEQFIMKRVYAQDPQSMESVEMEIRILETLPPHENVVHYFGSQKVSLGKNTFEYTILLEYCSGGSLFDLVNSWSRNSQRPSETQITTYFKEICRAVNHLHTRSPPIAHRDLKLENVLLDQAGKCKLIDFGSCTSRAKVYETRQDMENEEEIIQKTTTLIYRAPEMVDLYRKQLINEKVDVWALGCILYTMAYQRHPFQNGTNLQILNANVVIPDQPSFSPRFISILQSMFTPNPTQRPSVSRILSQFDDSSPVTSSTASFTPLQNAPTNTSDTRRTHSRTASAPNETKRSHSRTTSSSHEQQAQSQSQSQSPATQQTAIKTAPPVDLLGDLDSQFASLSTKPTAQPLQSWDPFANTQPTNQPSKTSSSFDPFGPSDFFAQPSPNTNAAPSSQSLNASWAADFAVLSPQQTHLKSPPQASQSVYPAPNPAPAFQPSFALASAPNSWANPQAQSQSQPQVVYATNQRPQPLGYPSSTQPFQQRAVYPNPTQTTLGFQSPQTPAAGKTTGSAVTTPKKASSPFDLVDPFATKAGAVQGANAGGNAGNSSFSSLGADDLSFFEK